MAKKTVDITFTLASNEAGVRPGDTVFVNGENVAITAVTGNIITAEGDDMKNELEKLNLFDVLICPDCGCGVEGLHITESFMYQCSCGTGFIVTSTRDSVGHLIKVMAGRNMTTSDTFTWVMKIRWKNLEPEWMCVDEGKEATEINKKIQEKWKAWKMAETLSDI